MEAVTIQKFIHTSPRKMRLVADMARKMEPGEALTVLPFVQKYAARDIVNAIKTVMANAKGKGMEQVTFKSIEINEGSKMKRFRAGTRGRAKPFARRMSHIKIVLTDEIIEKSKVQVKQNVILNASEESPANAGNKTETSSEILRSTQDDKIKKVKKEKK